MCVVLGRDVDMMQKSWAWPVAPYLPLRHSSKRDGRMPLTGYLLEGYGPVVYLGNIFMADPATDQQVPYPSYEAISADGWMVD